MFVINKIMSKLFASAIMLGLCNAAAYYSTTVNFSTSTNFFRYGYYPYGQLIVGDHSYCGSFTQAWDSYYTECIALCVYGTAGGQRQISTIASYYETPSGQSSNSMDQNYYSYSFGASFSYCSAIETDSTTRGSYWALTAYDSYGNYLFDTYAYL